MASRASYKDNMFFYFYKTTNCIVILKTYFEMNIKYRNSRFEVKTHTHT